jgi:hypothetical protein
MEHQAQLRLHPISNLHQNWDDMEKADRVQGPVQGARSRGIYPSEPVLDRRAAEVVNDGSEWQWYPLCRADSSRIQWRWFRLS